MSGTTYSQACIDLVKQSEGERAVPYDDARPDYVLKPGDKVFGTLTCGVGHTGPDVVIGEVWSQERIDWTLKSDLDEHECQMMALVKVPLSQGQTDGLLDWCFEEGVGRLKESTLLKVLNAGDYAAVPAEMMKWVYVGKTVASGLVRRREAEIKLWNS